MKAGLLAASALALAIGTPVAAQQPADPATAPSASTGATRAPAGRMGPAYPWQRNFWGYAGVSLGMSSYDINCVPGFGCDDEDSAARIFAGGNFNDVFGLEIAYVNFGKAQNAGGDTEAHGLNLSLTAGFPLGTNSAVFGKLGTIFARTKVSSSVPTVPTGDEDDWGLAYGIGARFGITDRLAVRLDADRYRLEFVGAGRRDVDTLTVGLQYRF